MLRQCLGLGDGGVISLVGAGGKTSLMFRLAHELSRSGESVLTTTTTKILRPTADQSPAVLLAESAEALLDHAAKLRSDTLHYTAARTSRPGSPDKMLGFLPEVIDVLYERAAAKWIIVEADGAAGRSLKAPEQHEPVVPGSSALVIGVVGLDVIGRPLSEETVFRSTRFAELTGLALGDEVGAPAVEAMVTHPQGLFKGAPGSANCCVFLNKADTGARRAVGRAIAANLQDDAKRSVTRACIGSARSDEPVLEVIRFS